MEPVARPGLPRRAGQMMVSKTLEVIIKTGTAAGRRLPAVQRDRRKVELVERDVAYGSGPMQRLDIYRPKGATGPLPTVLYVHGGGFRILSKDTHWAAALCFCALGYQVFTIDYRLAPENPFPAAIEDACTALTWVWQNGARYGADLSRLVLSGESAGGNLVTALAVAACWRRPEPWARAVFDAGVRPWAVVPKCGLLQVSDPDRYRGLGHPLWVLEHLHNVCRCYLPAERVGGDLAMANPLLVMESDSEPERPLPPFYVSAGTGDPIMHDSERLGAALERRGVRSVTRAWLREGHSFQLVYIKRNARDYWEALGVWLRGLEPDPA